MTNATKYVLIWNFIHYSYELDKVTLEEVKHDVLINQYFGEDTDELLPIIDECFKLIK